MLPCQFQFNLQLKREVYYKFNLGARIKGRSGSLNKLENMVYLYSL